MKKVKWIAIGILIVVTISITVENQFKVCDKIGSILSWSKNDCDEVDQKGAVGPLSFYTRILGLFNKTTIIVNNYGSTQDNLMAGVEPSLPQTNTVKVAEKPVAKEVVKNPPAMSRVVEDMLAAYQKNDFSNAVRFAHIGLEIMEPVLEPYKTKSFTIDARFAHNASSVYAMIAEEYWAKCDYRLASSNMQYAVSLCGGKPQPEILAMWAAITCDEKGEAVEIFPGKVLKALKGVGRTNAESDFMYRYLDVLCSSGFIQPVLVDVQGKGWLFSMNEYFGFSKKLKTRGVLKAVLPPNEKGESFTTGVIESFRYAGLGKTIRVFFPDFENRELGNDFDPMAYRFMTTIPAKRPLSFYKIPTVQP